MKIQKAPLFFSTGRPSGQTRAMTLLEVIAVIFAMWILAFLVLPRLDHPRQAPNAKCSSNLKQLQIAWLAYSEDNQDKLAQNIARSIGGGHYATNANQQGCQPGQTFASWVLGDASQPDPGFITHGLLYPYVQHLSPYKCPVDGKKNSTNGPTLRSYSMNAWMNGNPAWSSNCVNFVKRSDFTNSLSPDMALVFVDENPATINDGYWVQDPNSPARWIDSPARYHHHQNAGGLSFADGHFQLKQWTDRNVLAGSNVNFASDPASGDLAWVQARCTVKAPKAP